MAQMKTIRVEEFGEVDVLQYVDVERPEPGEGEVLIEVRSAGVNYADTMRRSNQYVESQDLPFTPGYAVAPARGLIPLPEDLDFDRAAAIPLQGLTAYHCIKTSGALKEGESVLVHAAAGGVGTLSVQIANLLGAGTVIATASSEEKLELARSLGADVLINYAEEDWPEKVREATDGKGADIILEMVGGDFPRKNLECLGVFGRMVVFGAASRERGTIVPASLMNRCHAVVGFYLPQIMRRPDLFVPSLQEILGWISSDDLKLTIGGTYPLEQAAVAHADLEGRQTTGKLLLNP